MSVGGSPREDLISRIEKLRAHAQSVAASFPDEAKLFRDKARELMRQHRISADELKRHATPPQAVKAARKAVARAKEQGATITFKAGNLRIRWRL